MVYAAPTAPVSNVSVPAARVAMVAAASAFVSLLSLHVLRPEFSPAWRMISEYATGNFNWVLSVMFVTYGLSSLALAFAIRSKRTTRRGKIGLTRVSRLIRSDSPIGWGAPALQTLKSNDRTRSPVAASSSQAALLREQLLPKASVSS